VLAGCNKPQNPTGSTKGDITIGAEVKDLDVTEKVKTALLNDGATHGLDITVVTTKGDVRLTGVVDTQSQFDKIDEIVRNIGGVHISKD
jgi:hyperosmotically inducible protein